MIVGVVQSVFTVVYYSVLCLPSPAIMESELLMREFELTEEHSNQQISDLHLEVISRTSSKQWRSLPPYLELPDTNILVGDIERDGQNEGERRHNFFFTWKDKKGTLATYRMLVHALLKINCRGDAEKVCKLLLESVSTRRRNFAPPVKTKPSQPTSDEGRVALHIKSMTLSD